ncbi:histidine phosphatase family protein [Thermus albus]|uniref:histidine phosphatase family protein n=1 Tax=Thermus albus TaxID=2908146 RepID=UPI001FA973D9|nr:histidine phosphatase family protein [Thermus albus]
MELWLVRHGETLWNREGRLLGWTDLPLTPLGEAQALGLKGRLPLLPSYSSDLKRAHHTALLAGFQPTLTHALREIHFGTLEGMRWEELDPRYREALLQFQGFAPPEGESLEAFKERVIRYLEELKAPSLLFTHGGVIRVALRALGEDTLPLPGSALVLDWPRRLLDRLDPGP